MPHVTVPIVDGCCTTRVGVGWSSALANLAAGLRIDVPPPVIGTALIDTGATLTCIDPSVVSRLRLTPKGTVSVLGVDGVGDARLLKLYDVVISVSHHGTKYTITQEAEVAETPLTDQNIDVLLGMDILSRCLLIVDGPAARFTLGI